MSRRQKFSWRPPLGKPNVTVRPSFLRTIEQGTLALAPRHSPNVHSSLSFEVSPLPTTIPDSDGRSFTFEATVEAEVLDIPSRVLTKLPAPRLTGLIPYLSILFAALLAILIARNTPFVPLPFVSILATPPSTLIASLVTPLLTRVLARFLRAPATSLSPTL